ncbi:unnamed protein product [Durusdinium trenchii]|uniref:Uncharacterized protein n=1 Tax=Durusdinium trenchii TaxID=1381693 RepID=A0ABP0RVI9_9DINO
MARLLGFGLALVVAGTAWTAFCGWATSGLSSRSGTALWAQPNFGDILGSVGKVGEAMKKMPEELQKRLRETPSTGSALGGKVKVTLSGLA